jgi:hypothetical protein
MHKYEGLEVLLHTYLTFALNDVNDQIPGVRG